jgi:hypothetical protein
MEIFMGLDKHARIVNFFCFGLVFLLLLSAVLLLKRGSLEPGIVLLFMGLALLPIAIVIRIALGASGSTSGSATMS